MMKIRTLKASLSEAGFIRLNRRGKGSHTIWRHKTNDINIVCSGKDSSEAKYYQVKALNIALAQVSANV
ncbi:MAG: type II toxin-antitoxin system HicA family toxin [Xenococcaceae cyanobacterium MO_207.B15]|nr:type II toxin-antitoxin system HicA family toxin [Xenococcaceae cyanobacterium MO_207.B15]